MGTVQAGAEQVILVDRHDRRVGTAEKLSAHTHPRLHRAFSIFVFNSQQSLLMQKRAEGKYHSAGLWSNTCCGHPRPGEPTRDAARRSLYEEMGFRTALRRALRFQYNIPVGDGLSEHEYNHVFTGAFDGTPISNPAEVADWRWIGLDEVVADARTNPEKYTQWFPPALHELLARRGEELSLMRV